MEANNTFINYGITDFKQNPMSETDFIEIFLSGYHGNARSRVNGLLGNILSKLKAAQMSGI